MRKYLLSILFLLSFVVLNAEEKHISKRFDIARIKQLVVDSKYGEITVVSHDKDEVVVDVLIKAESTKAETVTKIFDNVSVSLFPEGNRLVMKTKFGAFFTFIKFVNSLFRDETFSISYKIKAPKSLALSIELHNGNVVLFDRKAPLKLNHSNGYVSMQSLEGDCEFTLNDSFVKLNEVDSLQLNMRGGSLELAKADYIKMDTYNAKFVATKVDKLAIASSRDTYIIGEVDEVLSKSTLSQLNFGEISEYAIFICEYGGLQINKLDEEFDELTLTGRGAKLKVALAGSPAHITINHHQSTKMHIADELGLRMKFGKTNNEFISIGKVGVPRGENQMIINCRGGKLILDR